MDDLDTQGVGREPADPAETPGPAESASTAEAGLPSLARRLVSVFLSPGTLTQQLVREPKWGAALLVGACVVTLSVALIPVDVFMEMNRQAMMERGADLPETSEQARNAMRVVIPLGSFIMTLLITGVLAGVYTVVFAFVLGDEGEFVLHSSALRPPAHAAPNFDQRPAAHAESGQLRVLPAGRLLPERPQSPRSHSDMVDTRHCSGCPRHRSATQLRKRRGDPARDPHGHRTRGGSLHALTIGSASW